MAVSDETPAPPLAQAKLAAGVAGPQPLSASAPKYPKIQPAIAIKPKPSSAAATQKPTFNPRYDPSSSPTAFLSDETNINTSKRWVLPPRPRPGRKPTATCPKPVEERRFVAHKKHRLKKEDAEDPQVRPVVSRSVSLSSSPVPCVQPATPVASPAPRAAPSVTKQVADLQNTYLARLKEQELVQNYIDILTNQIKELKFVQSGVITFDALDSTSSSKPKVQASQPADQLDHINNVHDLDKFLAHLTTQSNVIHSVTKVYLGNQKEGPSLQQQIKQYLDLRAGHSRTVGDLSITPKSQPLKAVSARARSDVDANRRNTLGSEKPDVLLEMSPTKRASFPQIAKPGLKQNIFTPSLLRPLNMNSFDSDDSILDVDIINERDPFASAGHEKAKTDSSSSEGAESEFLNLTPDLKQNVHRFKKLGCGFCTGDAPCLCFDAESVFGEK